LNAFGSWTDRDRVRLSAGVQNLLDHKYEDRLAGFDLICGSDVALGSRLPGPAGGSYPAFSGRLILPTTLTDRSSVFLTGGPASAGLEARSVRPSFETKSGTRRLVRVTEQKSG
jgi:hypothetical protein